MAKKFDVVELYAGSFFYPMPTSGGSGGGGGAGGFGGGASGGGSSYAGGFISGSGTIISDFEGIIYIKYGDSPPYPVYVKPGKNEIYFFIPIILPVPTQTDATITIEAKGTILIPAGFKIVRKAGNTLTPVPNFKIVDKYGVMDFVAIDKQTVTPPVDIDLDDVVDEFKLEDFVDIDIVNATVKALDNIDILDIADFLDAEHLIPVEPVNIDGITDRVVLSDRSATELKPVNIKGTVRLDAYTVDDVVKIDKE